MQLGGTKDELLARLRREYPRAELRPMEEAYSPAFHAWMEALYRHVQDGTPHGDLPVDVRASAFQERVWSFLRSIPWGEVAHLRRGRRRHRRAARDTRRGRACATNPVALAIPCHRVIRGDGSLAGYRWGAERKRRLLDRERAAAS